jgi:hypothetical protein
MKAKPLVWKEGHPFEFEAKTPIGYTYSVSRPVSQKDMHKKWQLHWRWYTVRGERLEFLNFKSKEAAQEYAQAHFDGVICLCVN